MASGIQLSSCIPKGQPACSVCLGFLTPQSLPTLNKWILGLLVGSQTLTAVSLQKHAGPTSLENLKVWCSLSPFKLYPHCLFTHFTKSHTKSSVEPGPKITLHGSVQGFKNYVYSYFYFSLSYSSVGTLWWTWTIPLGDSFVASYYDWYLLWWAGWRR